MAPEDSEISDIWTSNPENLESCKDSKKETGVLGPQRHVGIDVGNSRVYCQLTLERDHPPAQGWREVGSGCQSSG